MKPHFNCPVQATINSISGKWKVQIIWHLSFSSLRFAKLRNKLKGISEKVLTDQLRQLESDDIISRAVTPTIPPRVDYSLTPAGKSLIPMMQELCDWGSHQFRIKPNLPQPKKHPIKWTTINGLFVAETPVDASGEGGAFGIAISAPMGPVVEFAAVDDLTNSLDIWTVKSSLLHKR